MMTYFQYFSLLFFPSKNIYTFTGNGTSSSGARKADEVRGCYETGFSYFGARYYDSDLSGLFMSVDPMSDKYPNISPYIYCAWNPIRFADPDGNERIVVSGGEYDGERYKYNFIEPAITKLKELKAIAGSEPITWLVASAGYSESDMADFKRVANELGVGFQTINSADEFTNYLNSKDVESSGLSKARMSDQITSISVFGHGYSGSVEFAHGQANSDQFSWGTDKVKKLNENAFYNTKVDFYSCNSATDTETERSLGYVFSQRTKTIVTGYKGKSTYTQMNNGEGFGAKWNRFWNGFNTNGSVKLPQAGMGAVKVKFLPPKGK